jgi:hypothetical protein
MTISFFDDLEEWSTISYNHSSDSFKGNAKLSRESLATLAAVSGGCVTEEEENTEFEYWTSGSFQALFREGGVGYYLAFTTWDGKVERCTANALNLAGSKQRGLEPAAIWEAEFDLNALLATGENTPPTDPPRQPLIPTPDPWRDFVLEPLSDVQQENGELPSTYGEWIAQLTSPKAKKPIEGLVFTLTNEPQTIRGPGSQVTVYKRLTGQLTDLSVHFKNESTPWMRLAYTRDNRRWNEWVFSPAYLEEMKELFEGRITSEPGIVERGSKSSYYHASISAKHHTRYRLLLRSGRFGYEVYYNLPNDWGEVPAEMHRAQTLKVKVYSLDGVGPLTPENIADPDELETLKQFEKLPVCTLFP